MHHDRRREISHSVPQHALDSARTISSNGKREDDLWQTASCSHIKSHKALTLLGLGLMPPLPPRPTASALASPQRLGRLGCRGLRALRCASALPVKRNVACGVKILNEVHVVQRPKPCFAKFLYETAQESGGEESRCPYLLTPGPSRSDGNGRGPSAEAVSGLRPHMSRRSTRRRGARGTAARRRLPVVALSTFMLLCSPRHTPVPPIRAGMTMYGATAPTWS
jgi:hypothetical protein